MIASENGALNRTPLHDLHLELGAKMVPFAGYEMPVQYQPGVLKEHLHTREAAGLFDVSHMGQVRLRGDNAAAALEQLVPGDIQTLTPGQMRYTQFTAENGGILDDLIVTDCGDHLHLVINAACKANDIAHLQARLPDAIEIEPLEDRALIALQGPAAAEVLASHCGGVETMAFMTSTVVEIDGVRCRVSRCGYTGEDGYEISLPQGDATALARQVLNHDAVLPIGLGARDSLRLEAGLCLYGHDIDETTSPVEAALLWSIGKRRREEGGFPGDTVIQQQITAGVSRKRVGIRPDGRAPAREGTEIVDEDGRPIGRITSGGFGPTVQGPVSMGYVETSFAAAGTELGLIIRGKTMAATVTALPFTPQRYYRG